MIRFIVFDFGGVFVTNGIKIARRIFSKKLKMDFEKFWFGEMGAYWDKLKVGDISEKYFWKKLKEKLKEKGKNFDEEEFKRLFFKYQRKNEKVAKTIENLRKKGYKTVILSNNVSNWIKEYEKKYKDLKKYFDVILVSDKIGYAKPDVKVYKILLKKIKAKPEECIFIDDKEKNLKTAEKIKMHTILFKNSRDLKNQLNKLLPG